MFFGKSKEKKNDGDFRFLVNVPDDIVASIVEGLLRSYDIPVKATADGNLDWVRLYMGNVMTNIDIYVKNKDYEKAKEILDNQMSIDEDSEIDGVPER